MSVWHVSVTIHLLAAIVWIGGMFFLALVGAPALRGLDDPALRSRLFHAIGVRFRTVGWWAIAILVATGLVNLHVRGLLSTEVLGSRDFWSTPMGTALAWKLGLVAAMVGLAALHDFWLGPAASRGGPGSPAAARARRAASWMARINAVLALALVWVAVRLARGG